MRSSTLVPLRLLLEHAVQAPSWDKDTLVLNLFIPSELTKIMLSRLASDSGGCEER